MTTATLVNQGQVTDTTAGRPRRSIEELVDQLMATLTFKDEKVEVREPSAARSIHEARRMRQAGDVDGALAVLAEMDTVGAETKLARWAFTEWMQLVKRLFRDRGAMVYSQGTGRAAALVAHRQTTAP